jgi:peptidoglycan/xylan/chitin deacetylase (PgdA/CDA1 family)
MKKTTITICIALCIALFTAPTTQAATQKQNRYIGLHDRLLPITDVRIIDSDTKVSLEAIAKSLYIPIEKTDGITHIRKRGIEISYNPKTKLTTQDGNEIQWNPIVELDGTLFISVKYIARITGFQIEYFKELNTLRIYRDTYEHMDHKTYIQHIQTVLNKTQKPAPKPTKPTAPLLTKTNVYLTFDDGPNQFTTINNATLAKYNVKGTFFFVGKNMKSNEKLIKSIKANGHYIGTHSMSHDKDKVYHSPEAFITEMNDTTKLLKSITGTESKLVRVPYGSVPHVTPDMQKLLNEYNYKMWDWDVDSKDWTMTEKDTEKILQTVQTEFYKALKAGDKDIVILLHDRVQTTIALPKIIEWLQSEGHTLKTYTPEKHIIQNYLNDKNL